MQSTPNLKVEDSEGEDGNEDRQKAKKEDSWKEITIPQAHSTHHHMTSQINYCTIMRQRKEEKKDQNS